MPAFRFLIALAVLCAGGSPALANATARPVLDPVRSLAAPMKPRRPAEAHPSPDGKAELIVSAEISGGDFPTSPVFVRSGKRLYALGEASAVRDVKWARDGRSVSLEVSRVEEYGVASVYRLTYKLGATSVERRLLRKDKVEASG